ncbi:MULTISPECIES: polysaccharide deacetylase family protein [unclassified Nocardioides]|uniref:polysaccharide deacetylase family protein n=1 Tax=unclassified Nocardioides TaxID=2615069 RepID=UPI0000EB639F|nr:MULTISPECIES: polysaccharide deacetylase family protein [unclassified Nocardioides]ABL82720.1 polysaccharide deacetylase [Nocardioides sp. JS614]
MRRIPVLVVVLVLVALLLGGVPAVAAPGGDRPIGPCSRGLVALTFDDGPSTAVTPRLAHRLDRLGVPATFFVVGTRVAAHPELARRLSEAGFAIGNHTWEHTDLTGQTGGQIRRALQRTRHALIEAGVPAPTLVRPPYGAVDGRVRRVLAAVGYTPVLWTIDSRDWSGGTPRQIARRVLTAVRPHRTNIVLQHDGVTHSPATLRAIPREVQALRERGFCFAALGPDGRPTPPVPVASVSADRPRVTEGGRVRLTVRLDRPTSRETTALVAAGGSASGTDFEMTTRRVRFGVGDQVAHLWLRTRQDDIDEVREEVDLKVFGGRGVQPALVWQAGVSIADDDPPPVARLVDATVTAAPLLATGASVRVRLDRASGRPVRVQVRSPLGRGGVVVAAGSRTATLTLTVPPGAPRDGVHDLPVRIVGATHARAGAGAVLTVRPPRQSRAEAIAAAVAAVRWPVATVPRIF